MAKKGIKLTKNVGYVVTLISSNGYLYFKGSTFDTRPVWTNDIEKARIYHGLGPARSAIRTASSILDNQRDLCQTKKVYILLEDDLQNKYKK